VFRGETAKKAGGGMNKRGLPFVPHSAQWDYLKLILLAMFVPMLIATACTYYIIWQTVANELAIPELIAQALFPAFDRVNKIMLIGLPLVCMVILFLSIQLSHQLAGPLYRIEKELDIMVKTKDFSKSIKIRPRDRLHSLVSKINRALTIKHRS